MRVFVTGGTGAIGGHRVPALVAAGHDVTAMARSGTKADVLRSQGAAAVQVSLFDRGGLTTAVSGHDVVVNLASALPSPQRFILKSAWTECQRIRTQGSATVVDAALAADAPRVVQESVAMMYRDGGDRWIDEEWPVDHYPIAAGNHAAESSARRFAESGRNAVVLRFGLFYGPGTHAMATAVGSKTWITGPGQLAGLLGNRATSMTRSLRVSNGRFRAAADWRPRYPSVREGYRAMAASTRAQSRA
jgi:nucleoside-diphosphate-sugar epimerase